jgi:hypothetical protein
MSRPQEGGRFLGGQPHTAAWQEHVRARGAAIGPREGRGLPPRGCSRASRIISFEAGGPYPDQLRRGCHGLRESGGVCLTETALPLDCRRDASMTGYGFSEAPTAGVMSSRPVAPLALDPESRTLSPSFRAFATRIQGRALSEARITERGKSPHGNRGCRWRSAGGS